VSARKRCPGVSAEVPILLDPERILYRKVDLFCVADEHPVPGSGQRMIGKELLGLAGTGLTT
jgi:hypothetical protein